ncbi:ABC transporter ATP-binding protein [Synergistales bacterium]|nr:ABC transporter ATP-binding protein [Synergistales bacterium]
MSVITVNNLFYYLPDGRLLLDNLTGSFGTENSNDKRKRVAMVGRNGVGKSVLAKIMAGLLSVVPPGSGSVTRSGPVFYLEQTTTPERFSDVADLAGVREVLDAARRVERGVGSARDLSLAEGKWDIEELLTKELTIAKLDYLTPDTSALALSGGEYTRVALAGAFLSGRAFLILDEPTNHLDSQSKRELMEYLRTWKNDCLLITHDRALLDEMDRITELSSHGLKSYGGNYSLYRERKTAEQAVVLDKLERAKIERRVANAETQASIERQQHRARNGKKRFADLGIPKLFKKSLKNTSEKTSGKLDAARDEKLARVALAEKKAFFDANIEPDMVFIPPECSVHAAKVVLRLNSVVLPYGDKTPIDRVITGPERIAIEGPNGSGKTTLLRVLRGEIAPLHGSCEVKVVFASLDQFATLPRGKTSPEILREVRDMSSGEAGTRLAQIGIAGNSLQVKSEFLSGGERLKVALLRALHKTPSPQLLILDEPTNHLDIDSVESVEKMLKAYTGALVVVSHDAVFLDACGVTGRLCLSATGAAP